MFSQYRYINSAVNKLHPITKLTVTITLLVTAMLIGTFSQLILIACFYFFAVKFANVRISEVLRDVLSFKLILTATMLIHIFVGFSIASQPLRELSWLYGSLETGAFFSIKIVLMISIIGLLLRTAHPAEMARYMSVISQGGTKMNRFASSLGITTELSIRFLPGLLSEAKRIKFAQQSRGVIYKGSIIKRITALNSLILPLLTAVLDKTDIITDAMQSRGYRLNRARTLYKKENLKWGDAASIFLLGILIFAIVN